MAINMDKRPNSGPLDDVRICKKKKTEPVFFSIETRSIPDLYHRFSLIPCRISNAVKVEGAFPSYLHASKIQVGTSEKNYVAAQAPLSEDKSNFWKAVFDGDYVIVDLTTKKDQYKGDERSLGVRPYYPETKEQKLKLEYHSIKLVEDHGNWKKYSVKDNKTKEIKEVWRLHFSKWPEYQVVSQENLAFLVDNMVKNKNIWVHCKDGVKRSGVVIAADLLNEQISKGEINLGNLDASVENLVKELQDQRLKSIPDKEQVELLKNYGKSLLYSRMSVDDL